MAQIIAKFDLSEEDWLPSTKEALARDGVAVISGVVQRTDCEQLCVDARSAFNRIQQEIGAERLHRAGESGVVRAPFRYEPNFFQLLENPVISQIVNEILGAHAICHLFNAICLDPLDNGTSLENPLFQSRLHRDFPRVFEGSLLSLNTFLCCSDFRQETGSTKFAIGSHQNNQAHARSEELYVFSIDAPAGSLVVFDSTIWHMGGQNRSSSPRIGINIQWTFHWVKQQIDLVRLLGVNYCKSLTPEVRSRLGYDSQVVTSLDEYYVAPEDRIYKGGQG